MTIWRRNAKPVLQICKRSYNGHRRTDMCRLPRTWKPPRKSHLLHRVPVSSTHMYMRVSRTHRMPLRSAAKNRTSLSCMSRTHSHTRRTPADHHTAQRGSEHGRNDTHTTHIIPTQHARTVAASLSTLHHSDCALRSHHRRVGLCYVRVLKNTYNTIKNTHDRPQT